MVCVTMISETEFEKICRQIFEDREAIIRNNPVGDREEILLWMFLGVLVSYLSISELESPCFSGKPDAHTYRNAIRFVLKDRTATEFDIEPYFDLLR